MIFVCKVRIGYSVFELSFGTEILFVSNTYPRNVDVYFVFQGGRKVCGLAA